MKRFLKTFICMALPLTLSACSFGENGGTQASQYQVVDGDKALAFADHLVDQYGERQFSHVSARYKSKVQNSSDDAGQTSAAESYELNYDGGLWSIINASNYDTYCTYSYSTFNNYYNFFGAYDRSLAAMGNGASVRFSIDQSNEKIKIELVFKNYEPQEKIRLEYNSSLYLMASLDSRTYSSGRIEAVSSQYNCDGEIEKDENDWFNHNYDIYPEYNGYLTAGQWHPIYFSYYRDGNHAGNVFFPDFFNNGVITDIGVDNADFNVGDYYIEVAPYQGAQSVRIFMRLFNGQEQSWYYDVTVNYWDNAMWATVTDAINNSGFNPNSQLYRCGVTVSGFIDNMAMPTQYGSFMIRDDYGRNYPIYYSTNRPMEQWLHSDGTYYYYDWYDDFYSFAPICTFYGSQYYPSSLMPNDTLEIIYSVDANGITFAYIVGCWFSEDRIADKYYAGGTLENVYNHVSAYGQGKYIYSNVPMKIKSYYGTNTNPTNYGDFVVSDLDGNGEYTVYGSTMYRDPRDVFAYYPTTDTFKFNNPRDFMDNPIYLGNIDGVDVYSKDLMPGDIIWMNFIVLNGRINGIITSYQLCSRNPKSEPAALNLSLHEIFQTSDANSERLYYTNGYVASFTTYGMYIKENIDDETAYFVYSATFNTNSFSFNTSTGLYEFSGRMRFGEDHGSLKICDYVEMVVTKNIYQGTPELIGYIYSLSSAPECYQLSSEQLNYDIMQGSSVQLMYTCYPSEARYRAVYSSMDNSVAMVDANGIVTAVGPVGSSTHVVVTIDSYSWTWIINVKEDTTLACQNISSDSNYYSMTVGDTLQLTYTCYPSSAASRAGFISFDSYVVLVDSYGLLTANNAGKTTVRLYIDDCIYDWTIEVFNSSTPSTFDPSQYTENFALSGSWAYGDSSVFVGMIDIRYADYLKVEVDATTIKTLRFETSVNGNNTGYIFDFTSGKIVDPSGNIISHTFGSGVFYIDLVKSGLKSGNVTDLRVYCGGEECAISFNIYTLDTISYCTEIGSAQGDFSMYVGSNYQLTFYCYPESARSRAQFSSSNSNVAYVNQDGLVSGMAPGQASITVTIDNVSYVWNVTVSDSYSYCTELYRNDSDTLTLDVGNSYQLQFSCAPAGCREHAVFESSNPSIAVVDNDGVVTTYAEGEAVITLTIDSYSISWRIIIHRAESPIVCESLTSLYSEYVKEVGQQFYVDFECYPLAASSNAVFTSSNESVATVDNYGYVTTKAAGVTIINLIIDNCSWSWTVYVNEPQTSQCVAITSDYDFFQLTYGDTYQLAYYLTPAGCSGDCVFTSSDTTVITVSETGLVTAVGCGQAYITLTVDGVSYQWSCLIFPIIRSTDASIYLNPGDMYQLNYIIEPGDCVVQFYSADESIATVDQNGVVTAVGTGEVTITMSVNGFGFSWTVYVS